VAVAALWANLWARLQGFEPTTKVSLTSPATGATDVPATGWARDYEPGARAGGGGARTRITAVLDWGLRFAPPGTPAATPFDPGLPGSFVLTERDSGRVVPLAAGYPRMASWFPGPGEHLVAVQPAADLAPCTWHEVASTDSLRDAQGRPVAPARWSFRTDGCPPAGNGPAPPSPPPTDGGAARTDPAVAPRAVTASPRYAG
jgi:hypothetical protein